MRNQERLGAPHVIQARSVTREAVGLVAGLRDAAGQRVKTGRIVFVHPVLHAADDGDFVHDPRGAGKMFADPQAGYRSCNRLELAANLCRRIRFHVERIEVTGSAVIENQDA